MEDILYRPHSGGTLSESIHKIRIFKSLEDMAKYIYRENYPCLENAKIIIGESMGRGDKRVGWKDVRYVMITGFGEKGYHENHISPWVIGYCDASSVLGINQETITFNCDDII